MAGLENSEKVLGTTIKFGQQLEASLADGFQPLQDIVSFIPVLTEIPTHIQNKELILAELTPFTEDKAVGIKDYVDTNLVLKNKKVENVIKGSVAVALAIYSLYLVLKPALPPTPPVV